MLLGYYKQYKLYCIIDWTIVMLMVCINNELCLHGIIFYSKTEELL